MQVRSFALLSLVLALALVPTVIDALPPLERRDDYSGFGTFYNVGLGSCGEGSADSEMVVALSVSRMQAGVCGRKITARTDRGAVTCTVVDKCIACGDNDVDFSSAAFEQLGDLTSGRITIDWSFD